MVAHACLRQSGVPKPRYKPRRFRLCAEKARSWQETAAFTTVGTFFRSRFPAGSRLILHRTPRRLRLMHAFVKRSPPFQAVLLDKSVHYLIERARCQIGQGIARKPAAEECASGDECNRFLDKS